MTDQTRLPAHCPHQLTQAYEQSRAQLVMPTLITSRAQGRQLGFQLSCTIPGGDPETRIAAAARMLLATAQLWPAEGIPEDFTPVVGSALHADAHRLVVSARPLGH